MNKLIIVILYVFLLPIWMVEVCMADSRYNEPAWEKEGDYYFLRKNTRDYFSGGSTEKRECATKYLTFNGIDFLVRDENKWDDCGKIELADNKICSLPVGDNKEIEELHLLIGGNIGNIYGNDEKLKQFGDSFFSSVVIAIFRYNDNTFKEASIPIFWDWASPSFDNWESNNARLIHLGKNILRKDGCSLYQASFTSLNNNKKMVNIILTDGWLSTYPSTDIVAVTIKSRDRLDSVLKKDLSFELSKSTPIEETKPDNKLKFGFEDGLQGWITGQSQNFSGKVNWNKELYGNKSVISIPAFNFREDHYSWMERKINLPSWQNIIMRFLRHSGAWSEYANCWTDGMLKVVLVRNDQEEVLYEKLYSGDWVVEEVDLSKFRDTMVTIRFEAHGAGNVTTSATTHPWCDGEEAIIDNIEIVK